MDRSPGRRTPVSSSEPGKPPDQRPSGSSPRRQRSGDFSNDPAFDPEQLFRVIGGEESVEHITAAMRAFLDHGDEPTFARAVAVFVRSARARREPIERVLAVLIELAGEREGVAYPHDLSPSDLRRLVLRGVLVAFYGEKEPPSRVKRRGVVDR